MAGPFLKGLQKTANAGFFHDAGKLDRHGLKLLMAAPAYHAYKAVKDKDKKEGVLAASEIGGLAMLHRAVGLAHK